MTMTGFGPTYACTLTGDVDIGLQADRQEATKAPLPVIEVKDLEGFCKTLEAGGVKLDAPYRKIPQTGFALAYLTDPWGTRIELTERAASAQNQKPAQQ